MTWHSNKGAITFLRLRITPNWSKYLLSHLFLLRRDGDNYFLTECAKYKEKWDKKNKCQIERHPRFADTASDKCAIPILRDATIGNGNRDNDFFRWVKTEGEIAASGIMADVSSLRQVENSFEQVEFHRQFIPNLKKIVKIILAIIILHLDFKLYHQLLFHFTTITSMDLINRWRQEKVWFLLFKKRIWVRALVFLPIIILSKKIFPNPSLIFFSTLTYFKKYQRPWRLWSVCKALHFLCI